MCSRCDDAMRRLYPMVPENERAGFLMGATAFPFGDHRQIRRQLFEARRKVGPSPGAALAYADAQMEDAMREAYEEEMRQQQRAEGGGDGR